MSNNVRCFSNTTQQERLKALIPSAKGIKHKTLNASRVGKTQDLTTKSETGSIKSRHLTMFVLSTVEVASLIQFRLQHSLVNMNIMCYYAIHPVDILLRLVLQHLSLGTWGARRAPLEH